MKAVNYTTSPARDESQVRNNACQEKYFLKEQGNIVNKKLETIIVSPETGKADFMAIHIYVEARSWFKPKKHINEHNNVIYLPKLHGDGWRTSLNSLAEKYRCSKETIRRKLVLLENLGLLTRDYREECRYGQISNNCLYILVWKETAFFYSEFGLEKSECTKNLEPLNYGEEATNTRYPIHKNVDIYNSNTNNNIKDTDILDILEVNNKTLELVEPKRSEFYQKNFEEKDIPVTNVEPIQISSDKTLLDYFPLTKEQLDTLNSRSNREFSVNFANELLKKLSKKCPNHHFENHNQFLSYMTKAFNREKHQGPLVNHPTFKFSANLTQEDKDNKNMEKLLSDIEYSQDISTDAQLRKKIVGRFDSKLAMEIMENYEFHHEVETNTLKIIRKNNFSQTEHSKEMLRNEIKSVYGSDVKITSDAPTRIYTNNVISLPQIEKQPITSTVDCIKPISKREPTLWEKVMLELRRYISPSEERSWFSNISITEVDGNIILKGGTPVVNARLKSDFHAVLNMSFKTQGYQLKRFWFDDKTGIVFEPIKIGENL